MEWNQAFNWVMGYVLRWTVGAAIFGILLEYMLSLFNGAYRLEVPVLMTTMIFSLSMMGGLTSLYMAWLVRRYQA